jgi:hypothetical protein
LAGGRFTVSTVHKALEDGVGHLESVWASLYLPGQNPETAAPWGRSVGDGSMKLIRSYGDMKPLLDQYSRVPRKWDDLQWPEVFQPF